MQCGVDLAAPEAGRKRDVVDQGTDGLGRLVAFLWAPERLGEPFHLPTIEAGDVRMNIRDIHRRAR
ncbi:MAG: hypothetical protein R3D62_08330 [Xanthobacteraceae bacterium]